jgi:5,6-dimethylbenzimidazole synthase
VVESLEMTANAMTSNAFSDAERAAVYRAIAERRDVRHGFLPATLPEATLERLLTAAHQAPSVGLMQPTRFVVVRNPEVRASIYKAFSEANAAALATYDEARKTQYASLKLEGLREAPQHLCLLCDANSTRGHNLGRHTMPETALYSTVCAVQNLWLAARAEGIGVGWVSILDPKALCQILRVPEHITPVAYLCIGYVDAFAAEPDLERFGWETRVPLDRFISYDRFEENAEEANS